MEPQEYEIGVLLVHGLNGSRRDMAELEMELQDCWHPHN